MSLGGGEGAGVVSDSGLVPGDSGPCARERNSDSHILWAEVNDWPVGVTCTKRIIKMRTRISQICSSFPFLFELKSEMNFLFKTRSVVKKTQTCENI